MGIGKVCKCAAVLLARLLEPGESTLRGAEWHVRLSVPRQADQCEFQGIKTMSGPGASPVLDQISHGYRIDRRYGLVFDRRPLGSDDLTLIRGIQTREAVQLNRLGVYQLAQIALWERREVAAFADELGMAVSSLLDECWVEQANELCYVPRSDQAVITKSEVLPASFVRTATLLVFATMVGCFVVYWLNLQRDQAFQGVLSAEITSIRVPAPSRLLSAHVQAGDEVFTGQPLLTLEKTEHLAMIDDQGRRVQELRQQLQRAEAQASLDLEWRVRDVESEIVEMQTRAHLIQEVKRGAPELLRSVSLPTAHPYGGDDAEIAYDPQTVNTAQLNTAQLNTTQLNVKPVSASHEVVARSVPNGFMFFASSGASSPVPETENSVSLPVSRAVPQHAAPTDKPMTRIAMANGPKRSAMLQLEAQTVQQRLARLEDLRLTLPEQVRRAAGVETLKSQLDENERKLKMMQELSRDVSVACPSYGRVGQVRYRVGDSMGAGEIMLKLLHTDRRFVTVNIPTSQIDRVQPGDQVDLIFPDDRTYAGRVTDLPMIADVSVSGRTAASVRIEHMGRLWAEAPIGSHIEVRVR